MSNEKYQVKNQPSTFLTSQQVGLFVLIGAIGFAIFGYFNQHGHLFTPFPFVTDFYANISTELISIAVTVLVIDNLNSRRIIQQEKSRLILQMGSPTNSIAKEAVRILRVQGWLMDGTLRGANFLRANLQKAYLEEAYLAEANFYKTNLQGAYLQKCNLTGAKHLEDWQLVQIKYLRGAILPDGLKYNGRFNLIGDLSWAHYGLHIPPRSYKKMAEFYGVSVEDYRRGQLWAKKNLAKLRTAARIQNRKKTRPFGKARINKNKNYSMTITQRPYSYDQDNQMMIDLACRFQESHLHVVDLPYRLSSWAFDDAENIRLWFDGENLVAWAVLQSPFWGIDYVCHADYQASLFKEILVWADGRAQAVIGTPYERSAWFVIVFSGQESRRNDLEAMGFAPQSDVGEDSWSKVFMKLSPEPKLYELPAGFTVRPLGGEVEKYVELHQSVFESKNMTLEWRRRTLESPLYRPELDLVVESPTGELAAFCICWFNETISSGQFEPLGVHADYRQLGLGKVALSHGVSRLRSLGAKDIYVETDNYRNEAFNLYQSFGFEVIQDVLVYRKDYVK